MENGHKQSSYNRSCIHPPRHPKSHHPSPKFERQLLQNPHLRPRPRHRRTNTATCSTSLGHDQNPSLVQGDFNHELDRKFRAETQTSDEEEDDSFCIKSIKSNVLEEVERENYRFRSMSDFYESIPDYNDLHHLSEAEFYTRLERLKIQQQELMDLVEGTTSSSSPTRLKLETTQLEPVPQQPNLPTSRTDVEADLRREKLIDDDCQSVLSLESAAKAQRPTSSMSKTKKSVRISSGTTYRTDFSDIYDDFVVDSGGDFDENARLLSAANPRSKSASPRRTTRSLTIPKPFKMTQREEEERMMEDLANSKHYLSKILINFDEHPPTASTRPPKITPFKANPVPLTSRIPLYEHIKEDHRRKSALAKLNSAIELQAQIKPFKFNGEKGTSSRCLSRATSVPNLNGSDQRAGGSSSFKASPCPKNLFSNYFYNKMWEDDYFRAVNRKIRAEEMLKISNLPPSMAKRAENYFSDDVGHSKTSQKSRRRKRKCKKSRQEKTYEFKDKDSLQGSIRTKRSNRQHALSNSSMVSSSCETTPIPTSYPVNRPNLAATLRVQSARQKVRDLAKPKSIVPENRLTVSATKVGVHGAWGVKRAPAWRSMTYDPSNMEDIALRLSTRRAEQRLRQEEHEISMELMKQRVRAAPLLLEGPTYWGPKVGQVSHHCPPSAPKSSNRRRTPSRCNSSKLSFYSVDSRKDD